MCLSVWFCQIKCIGLNSQKYLQSLLIHFDQGRSSPFRKSLSFYQPGFSGCYSCLWEHWNSMLQRVRAKNVLLLAQAAFKSEAWIRGDGGNNCAHYSPSSAQNWEYTRSFCLRVSFRAWQSWVRGQYSANSTFREGYQQARLKLKKGDTYYSSMWSSYFWKVIHPKFIIILKTFGLGGFYLVRQRWKNMSDLCMRRDTEVSMMWIKANMKVSGIVTVLLMLFSRVTVIIIIIIVLLIIRLSSQAFSSGHQRNVLYSIVNCTHGHSVQATELTRN